MSSLPSTPSISTLAELPNDTVSDVTVAREDEPYLEPVIDQILSKCPQFRILVVGKSGAGKSSLINKAFGVNLPVSHDKPGESDINQEITSAMNKQLIVHDSKGLELGETQNFGTVKNFLDHRRKRANVAERIHAIWLCMECPFNNSRLFERGVENLFLSREDVPLICVFTKYDMFVTSHKRELLRQQKRRPEKMSKEALTDKSNELAYTDYVEKCINQLEDFFKEAKIPPVPYIAVSDRDGYADRIENLIQLTFEEVKKSSTLESTADTLAVAQRANSSLNVQSVISIGRKGYWRGLLSATGASLKAHLYVVHTDIIQLWNLNIQDPNLLQNNLKVHILKLIPEDSSVVKGQATLKRGIKSASVASGVSGAIAAAVAPPSAAVVVPVVFISTVLTVWVHDSASRVESTLRRLFGYIVHLIMVLQILSQAPAQDTLNAEFIRQRVEGYAESEDKTRIDEHIKKELVDINTLKALDRGNLLDKLTTLIEGNVIKIRSR